MPVKRKKIVILLSFTFLFVLSAIPVMCPAGPFGYGDGFEVYPGISMDDPAIIRWATGWEDYKPGGYLYDEYKTPEKALGKAAGNTYDIVSLGRGGSIVTTFAPPIRNGKGWDFAVFENSFDGRFLELAFVEVSSDGENFVPFPSCSLTHSPVSAFGTIDPADITGFAGKYRQGYGTPFDLNDLAITQEAKTGIIDLDHVGYIRIIDIIGGRSFDNRTDAWKRRWGKNSVIYDPYPTIGSAGFDLEAIGVSGFSDIENTPPYPPIPKMPYPGEEVMPAALTLSLESFFDPDELDRHIKTHWQISTDPDFSYLVLDIESTLSLSSLALKGPILEWGVKYYWHARFYDESGKESIWSYPVFFITSNPQIDINSNGIPDDKEFEKDSIIDLNNDTIPDITQFDNRFKGLNIFTGNAQTVIEVLSLDASVEFFESIDPGIFFEHESKPDNIPLGLLGFRLKTPDHSIRAILYFSKDISDNARWYVYDSGYLKWEDYSSKTYISNDRKSLTVEFQDGKLGDMDGTENGIIVIIGGQGYFADDDAGFGRLSGCFISTLSLKEDTHKEPLKRHKDQQEKKDEANPPDQKLRKSREDEKFNKHNDFNTIISLAPSITEVLFTLGLGDRVVGVTDFCDYPEEAKAKNKVGGYYDTSYETILSLMPDLVIMLPEHENQREYLKKLGIDILVVDQRDTIGILDSILKIGRLCKKEEKAKYIIDNINSRIERIKEKTKGLAPPRVMICIGRTYGSGNIEDVYICGSKGFYNEWIMLAGGTNVYKEGLIRYPTVTGEGITRMNPEVIIEVVPDLNDRGLKKETLIKEWESLPWVDALKNHRIYIFGQDYVATPGPRFILILEEMARSIHPEAEWE